jgi:hypothetical protein
VIRRAGLIAVAALAVCGCSQSSAGTSTPPSHAAKPVVRFRSPVSYTGGRDPEALAIADLNGDGHPDVVTANSYGNDVSVFLGNGDGTLRNAHEFPAGTAPASVAIMDLNGDGRLDIATTNGGLAEGEAEEINGSNDISVMLGRGDGTFAKRVNYPAGDVPSGLVMADLNGDGSPDLLTVDRHQSQLALLRGGGDGTFRPYTRIPINGLTLSRRLTAADLNGDGVVDVVVPAESDGSVVVLTGTGHGTFDQKSYPENGIEPVAVTVADLNGDGKPDLAVANGYPAHDTSVILARGGGFGPDHTYPTGFAPHSIVATDLNGDGIPDLAVGNVGASTVSILLGRGDGTFGRKLDLPTGSTATNNTIAVAYMNGDGRPDLVTANYKPSSLVTVLLQSVG